MIDFIAKLLGYIIDWIYIGLSSVGIANLGLTIIIFSLIMRLILFPLTYSQQKKSKITQYIQPELNKVAKKYRGKKDQESMMKMQMEQQEIYKKYGSSPTSGCLTMLIQFPILFGIIKIVYNIPNYISSVGNVYMNIAEPMVKAGKDVVGKMSDLAVELRASNYFKDYGSTTDVISLLGRFKEDSWDKSKEIFADFPDVISNINEYVPQIRDLNEFILGINIAEYPSAHKISVYLIIPILAAFFQWLQTKTIKQPDMPDGSMAGMQTYMKVMMNTMPIMSLVIYYSLPCGIGLYWAATAFFTVIQQVGLNWYFNRIDMEKLIEKQVEKAKKSNKKSFYEKMMEASTGAATDTANNQNGNNAKIPNGATVNKNKTITNAAKMNLKKLDSVSIQPVQRDEGNVEEKETEDKMILKSKKKHSSNEQGLSIAEIANMLKEDK